MFTVVRYSVMRSFWTTALIETTSAPVIPRSVFAASSTATAAAWAKLSVDEPMIVTTFAMSAISTPLTRGTRRRYPSKGRRYTCPPVFDTLSDKLQSALGDLRGRGRLDEEAISRAMREIRLALLEADVNFEVVKDFVAHVRERALGQEVLKSITPGQQVVKAVHEELTALMGAGSSKLVFTGRPPTVILLAGLQGSGKTTAAAKLALLMRKEGRKPGLVAADLQRPAAVDQLEQLGRQIQIPVFTGSDPVEAA